MFRSSLIVAGAALLCSTAAAQHRIDPARLVPITGPIRDAGTVDVTTGKWTAPGAQQKKAVQTVYNNTCSWINPLYYTYYAGYGECEDSYDEGAIPSTTRPGAPPEAADSQTMTSVAILYCTTATTPAGGIDIELAFWDKLNGNCVGGVPPTPPNWASTATAYIPLGGLGLPGTPTGTLACWIVTLDVSNGGWVMQSDGDGIYNGLDDDDSFVWGKRFNTVSPSNGFAIQGEPITGAPGSCSYSIPCGTDPVWAGGATCGTGLDTWDGEWINVDGVAVGSSAPTPPGCTTSVAQYGYGTNCYWFGGYPTNPFDSYWLILEGETGGGIGTFCTSLPAGGLGASCTATLTAPAATVSKTVGAGQFFLSLAPVPGGPQAGVFIWRQSLIATPVFKDPNILQSAGGGFGWRCIIPVRGSPDLPGGTAGQCNGQYDWDLGAYMGGAGSGLINVGDDLYIQGWFRDPTYTAGALFSQGVGPINVTP